MHIPIQTWLNHHRDDLIRDTMELIAIRSVSEPGEEKYPYGAGCAKALDYVLHRARLLGFETQNHAYHCGSVLLPGTIREEIGIFTHLDVVHEGEGWQVCEPFQPVLRDGWLYGRGSADNKGPAIAALYTMCLLRENAPQLRHTIRLYFGCNEECGMKDIEYFRKAVPHPAFSLIPDARFSVCYAEKGILEAEYTTPLTGNLLYFSAGVSSNAVPARAQALVAGVSLAKAKKLAGCFPEITCEEREQGVLFEAAGKSAHAAFPEGADSAAVKLAAFLRGTSFLEEASARCLCFPSEAFADFNGEAMGIACRDGISGSLTMVGGLIRTKGNRLIQNVNIRYPVLVSSDGIIERLDAKARNLGWERLFVHDNPPSCIDPDTPVIQTLDEVCRQVLGDAGGMPYTMGGGTYARKLPNAVAYGPGSLMQQKPCPPGHGGGHQPDECVSVDALLNMIEVYTLAIEAIDTLV